MLTRRIRQALWLSRCVRMLIVTPSIPVVREPEIPSRRFRSFLIVLLASILVLIPSSGLAQTEDQLVLIYPRMTHDSISTTGIALANRAAVTANCAFLLVTNTGEVIDAASREVPALDQLALTLKEVFPTAPAIFDGFMVVVSEKNIGVVGFFLSYTADTSKIDGAEAIVYEETPPSEILFPEVASGPEAYTEITLLGSTGTDYLAVPLDATVKVIEEDDGVVTIRQKVVQIPAAPAFGIGRFSARLSDIFPGITLPAKSYVRVSATKAGTTVPAGIFGYEQFGNANSIAGRNAFPVSAARTVPLALFGAQLAEAAGYTSEITIINPTNSDADVSITAYKTGISSQPSGSRSLTIRKNSIVKEKTRALIPNLASDFGIGWIRVDSTISGIVGVISFGDEKPAKNFQSSVQLQASPVTDYVFSQVAEGLGFVTGITFLNPNSDPTSVDVDVYDSDGNPTGSGSFELRGREHKPQVLGDIIHQPGFQQIRGFITVRSDLPIFSFELFLYLPVSSAGVVSLSAVPPQLGHGTISGKVTPGVSSDIGNIYVQALDPTTLETKGQATAVFSDGYTFHVPPIFAGGYIVVAGNDKNGDSMLGGTGEYFAVYPESSQPSLVYVRVNEDTSGIDFGLDAPQAQAGAAVLDEWKRKTGTAGIPIRATTHTRLRW